MVSKNLNNILLNERKKFDEVRCYSRKNAMDPSSNYDSFNLMTDLSNAVISMVENVYEYESQKIYSDSLVDNFAIFLYGSSSRNEMSSYSDIDIHIIDEKNSLESNLLKKNIIDDLDTFRFGKIDDPNWKNLKTIEKYVSKSITEGNQIIDAKYICGDKSISKNIQLMKDKYDDLERNVKNIFFQKFYLEHYYSNRSSEDVPNVKYSSGGYRDLLTFDWFDKTMDISYNLWLKNSSEGPYVLNALHNLYLNNLIDKSQFQQIKTSVNFISLLRNEMLHVNINTSDEGITHLDPNTRERLWNFSKDYFQFEGAKNSDDILKLFNQHSEIVSWTKELMWKNILALETRIRGTKWRVSLDEILDIKTPGFRRISLSETDDELLQIASVWGSHYYGDQDIFSTIAKNYVSNSNWEVQASLACSNLTPPEVLHEIGSERAKEEGLGYILRIIGRNPSTSKETLISIVEDSSLEDRYRKVARLNLEKGLLIATTRAS